MSLDSSTRPRCATAVVPLTGDYRSTPYWSDGVELPQGSTSALPAEADVVVVGSGFTGLGAALELARRDRSVVVIDEGPVCGGASSRNGGMVHPGAKHDLPTLLATASGRTLWDETVAAFEAVETLITELGISCDWQRTGHLALAGHHRHDESLRHEEKAYRSVGEDARFLSGDDLRTEIGSTRFGSGLVVTRSAAVHPGRLASGVAHAVMSMGAEVYSPVAALGVAALGGGLQVTTTAGVIRAKDVVVATNGTTDGRLVPWLGRRVLGVGSFIIATEPLPPDLAASVSPRGRMFFDSRNFLNYWRLSPDGSRVLFGGRTSFAPMSVEEARDRLYGAMVAVHPQLAGVGVGRAWGGQVALTRDRLPHVGRHRQSTVVYAMGYCGTGVALSLHFGRRVGRWLCGDGELPAFAQCRWPRVPAPARRTQLLRMAGWWYRARDWAGR